MEISDTEVETVGIVGSAGIDARVVETLAHAGHRVIILESHSGQLDDLAHVGLVIETGRDELEAKRAALAAAAGIVGPATPIATTTSVLSVTDLAASVPNPERVAGLHFVDMLPTSRTVEVVRALRTGDLVIDRLTDLVSTLAGKEAVVVEDRPGFLVNALQLPYLNDVIQAFDEGLASAEDIDIAIKLGLGYTTGPLELLDAIGLDEHLRRTQALYTATCDERYAPPPLLRRMVAAGKLGASTGHGFHDRRPTSS